MQLHRLGVLIVFAAACGQALDASDFTRRTNAVVIDIDSDRIKVRHGYLGILGREPDEGGWQAHTDYLQGGATSEQFCAILFGSEEFAVRRGGLSPELLADELYRGILEREADPGGREYTASEIRAGRGAARAAAMLDSEEFAERFLGGTTPPGSTHDSQVVDRSLPTALHCGERFRGFVSMKNTGSATWRFAAETKLGIPPAQWEAGIRLASGDPGRVWLPLNATIPTGATYRFEFDHRAPSSPGRYSFALQMVQEGVAWFGATASSEVEVACPPPAPGFPAPLYLQGNQFYAAGQPVRLLGSVVCCEDYPANGWPLVSETYIDKMASAGLNWTHVRTGPFIPDAETPDSVAHVTDRGTGLQDLTQYWPQFFDRLRGVISRAGLGGMYVEVDLIDAWPFKHELSAFSAGRNVQGANGSCDWFKKPPNAWMEGWVRKIVASTGDLPNVMYQIGNESFGCGSSDAYELGIYAIVKDELSERGFPDRLVGSNSLRTYLAVDYHVSHDNFLPMPEDKPVVVNEFSLEDPETDPMEVALMAAMRLDRGVYYMAWRGSLPNAAYDTYLDLFGQARAGTLSPSPDYECAQIARIGVKIHNKPSPGAYVLDATPKDGSNRPLGPEGSLRRLRCEADQVDGELHRGPMWQVIDGQGNAAANKNPYLFKVFPTTTMRIRSCSRRFTSACGQIELTP